MATYDPVTFIFTLDTTELNFEIPFNLPDTLPPTRTPDNSGVRGNALNNLITGDATDNALFGEGGNDTLIGGLGLDTFDGGAGFDTVSYAYAGAGINISLRPAPPSLLADDIDDFVSIEGIIGSRHNDTIKGANTVGELLQGGEGNDSIEGGGGDDTIEGGLGSDRLFGGDGIDTLTYANAAGGANADLYYETGAAEDNSTDRIEGFENIFGSQFRDILGGDAKANILNGSGGNDNLVGRQGNDTLIGGTGADDMQGQEDNDLYYVDDALDYVRESNRNGYDTIITSVTFDVAARGDGEIEVLQAASGFAAINLYANSIANRLIGNSGNNVLDGRAGADTMEGGAGDDIYYVDNASDAVIDTQGNNIVYTSASFNGTQVSGKVVGTGSAAISLTGDAFANTILGNGGANRINGRSGNDILTGDAGKDSFVFDSKIGDFKTNKNINLDRITDFKVKQDKLLLDNAIFKKLGKPGKLKADFFKAGSKAAEKNDYLVYNKGKKTLSYDVDGSGSKKAVEIIKFDGKINLSVADIWVI